ncbi:hypothetical protein H0O02_02745 [Candidatus Micrarchaeota archaeon]|nr:hypothetical protein [Candidatus Micrarchaeota archaeon]
MGENESTEENKKAEDELIKQSICPVCKAKLKHTEGCLECAACGWSLCLEA